MRTFSLLKGLPVYERKSGEKIGEVCDLDITGDGKVRGILLQNGAFFKKTFIIKIDDIASFGWDGLMVNDRRVLELLEQSPEHTIKHDHSLSGKMMMTMDGKKLGLLEDVYFMEEVGTIVGYELTDGFFADITEGKRIVRTAQPPAIGKDAIIVNVNQGEVSSHAQVPELPE